MIPSPNLDDKTYQEIVDEALSLIPHYTPEWTNHNPSDPGVTMVELFSWMTEMVLYRLNRVPDKTYFALLDLMGMTLSSPQASRVLLRFQPVEGYEDTIEIHKGFQVSTGRSDGQEAVVFETDRPLTIQQNSIVSSYSCDRTLISDNSLFFTEGQMGAYPLFQATEEVERFLYFSSATLKYLQDSNQVCLQLNQSMDITTTDDELFSYLEWEFWDGDRWKSVEPQYYRKGVKRQNNTVYFTGPVNIEPFALEENEAYFIRASFKNFPSDGRCFDIESVTTQLIFLGDGLQPQVCFFNSSSYLPLDLDKDFKPFGDSPVVDDIFYLACDEVLSKTGAMISVNVLLNESVLPSLPQDIFIMKYEYWDGKDWSLIGSSRPGEEFSGSGISGFKDSTAAFCHSGTISFLCPENMTKREVNKMDNFWIRARVSVEDMGKGGGYNTSEGGRWEWSFSEKIVAPLVSRIRLSYDGGHHSIDRLSVFSDYTYTDFSKDIIDNYNALQKKELSTPATLIKIAQDKSPYTCFGFERALPAGEVSLFFHMDEADAREDFFDQSFQIQRKRRLSLRWEYCQEGEWKKINVNDFTDSLHRSGFVELQIPQGWNPCEAFNQELCWIRVVFENGSFESLPLLKNIYFNGVYASNSRTFYKEVLGSGSGSPFQEYSLVRTPVLPGFELEVRESTFPPKEERDLVEKDEGNDAIRLEKNREGKEEVWIKYHQVNNFYESTSKSRHYILDYQNNKILFGDGKRGVIPPRGKKNILISRCHVGGGLKGNVGPGSIKILRESIPFLAGVENPLPAQGGADLETLENLKRRASGVFRSRNRAVTSEDFAWLSYEASSSVGRAICLPRVNNQGEIVVILLPRRENIDLSEKLYPSSELVRRVKDYLSERKLVGTKLQVSGPLYRNISINLKLVFRKEVLETGTAKEGIITTLRQELHSLLGHGGEGWPFGTPLQKEFIQRVMDRIPSIHHLEEITLIDERSGLEQERITLRDDELFYLNNLTVEERRSEF